MSSSESVPDISYVGEDDAEWFRQLHGRSFNVLNPTYLLPADADEVQRFTYHHRLMQFLFDGKNYTGPVRQALQFGEHRRILDLGTGVGLWAVEMADEFQKAEVIGIDIAPLQPREVPPNCTFELCDLDNSIIPYPDKYFDVIHARSMHTGIKYYDFLLREVARLLRPGGLVLISEPDLVPGVEVNEVTRFGNIDDAVEAPGWFTLWETYRGCLTRLGVDCTVPQRLSELVGATGSFERIVQREFMVPVGSWPSSEALLTVGQLQWLDYDHLLPALKPMFLTCGIPVEQVCRIIKSAQEDLYHPSVNLCSRIHILYASKII